MVQCSRRLSLNVVLCMTDQRFCMQREENGDVTQLPAQVLFFNCFLMDTTTPTMSISVHFWLLTRYLSLQQLHFVLGQVVAPAPWACPIRSGVLASLRVRRIWGCCDHYHKQWFQVF